MMLKQFLETIQSSSKELKKGKIVLLKKLMFGYQLKRKKDLPIKAYNFPMDGALK